MGKTHTLKFKDISGKSKNLRDIYAFIEIGPNNRDIYAVINGVEYNLRLRPELKDRWPEFEAMYYYESKVVLNGVEMNYWDDGYDPVHWEALNYIGTRPDYVILPAMTPSDILHIDGDDSYLDRCMKLYNELGIKANGISLKEHFISSKIVSLIKEYRPDIVVITGHDAYYSKKNKIYLVTHM